MARVEQANLGLMESSVITEVDYMTVPPENQVWRYGCQAHVRGASVHLDLRLEVDKQTLVGWTIDLPKSILAELILKFSNEEEFRAALKKDILKGKGWRQFLKEVIEDTTFKLKDDLSEALDPKYKDKIGRYTKDMKWEEIAEIIRPYKERIKAFFSDPNNKALCQTKAPEPHEWMVVERRPLEEFIEEGRVEPGEVGATATLPGFFVMIDKGEVEYGAQKQYYHEYWLWGDVFHGHFIWRLLARTKKWQKAGRRRQIWMCWRAKPDKEPYVLSTRAVKKGWMPPEGHSALPKYIREQIPDHYQYWKYPKAKAKEIRDALVKAIKKKEVTLRLEESVEAEKYKYAVKRCWWKGQVVVRGMPQIFYVLLFYKDKKIHSAWHFLPKPIIERLEEYIGMSIEEFLSCKCQEVWEQIQEQIQTVPLEPETYEDGKLLADSGELPVGHPLNPNKRLPLHFDTIDSGEAELIASDANVFYRWRLKGKLMKGIYVLKRDSPHSELWTWNKSELPTPEEAVTPSHPFVLHKHYGEVETHWDIRIKMDDHLLEWNVYADPLEMGRGDEAKARQKTCSDLSWFITEGEHIKKMVADKETYIDVIDKGEARIRVKTDEETVFSLDGEKIHGTFRYLSKTETIRKISAVAEQQYAPVPPSGKNLGKEIRPGIVLDAFKKPIKLQDAYIYLANPERVTHGDVDIFIRAPMAVLKDDKLDKMSREELVELVKYYKTQLHLMHDWHYRALVFRLMRAVKAKHPELVDRLDIRHDMRGPFTTYIPLYDLVLVPCEKQEPIEMSVQEVERQIRESFRWAKRYNIDQLKSTDKELWIRGEAVFPTCSLNQRCYTREEIKKMARTAIGKPIMVNHGEPPYEGLRIGIIEDAEEEEGKLEFIARITDPEWIKRIKEMPEDERWLSIGAEPRESEERQGKIYPKGLVIEEISILVPPAKPGVPGARYEVKLDTWR